MSFCSKGSLCTIITADLPNSVNIVYYHRYWHSPITVILVCFGFYIAFCTFSHECYGSWTILLPGTDQILGNAEYLLGRMLWGNPLTRLLNHLNHTSNSDYQFQFQLEYFLSCLLCNFDLLNVQLRIWIHVSSWTASYHKIDTFGFPFAGT